jgi:hypothetical protein
MSAYVHTHQTQYVNNAMAAYRVAVKFKSAPISQQLRVTKFKWSFHGPGDAKHESALDAYHAAIELLPHIVMLISSACFSIWQ